MEIEIKKSKTYKIILQRKKMKRMILRYRDGNYYLSAPLQMPLSAIQNWLNDLDEDKIKKLKQQTKLKQGTDFVYLFGQKYALIHRPLGENKVIVKAQGVYVYGNSLTKSLDQFLKAQLYQYVDQRINAYIKAGVISFMPEIEIQKMKSRYGVCFYKERRVKFALTLVHEPQPVIDSIIIHELGHFYYPNHSHDFYSWIAKYDKTYGIHEDYLKKGGAGDDPVDKE